MFTRFWKCAALALGAFAVLVSPLAASSDGDGPGSVYVLTNAPTGNAVVAFTRRADGRLKPAGSYPTGGLGSGAGLGSQDAIVVSDNHRFVFVVNAGSHTISSFRIDEAGLTFVEQVASGGMMPTSLAYRHGLLYVLNAGQPNQLNGFHVNARGRMRPIPGSARALSAAQTAPAQVGFSEDGDTLIVTERATNLIGAYVVGDDGLLDGPVLTPSAGPTPFGFAFTRQGTLLVSEAGAGGGASTYRVNDGDVTPVSAMLMTGQRAACWAVITRNGRFGYVSNAGTGNISGFSLDRDGSATLLDADGITAVTGGNPTDMAFSQDSRFLYVRIGASNEIAVLTVGRNGSLNAHLPRAAIPVGAAGLAGF